jgi:MFS family permease
LGTASVSALKFSGTDRRHGFSYDNGVAGGLLDLPAWVELFPEIDTVNTTGAQKKHNSHIQGTVVAVYTLGALFGALSCALIGDWLGRRRTIMLGTVVTSIGSILQCSTFSFAQLIIGRFITGLGLGAISATAPNWQVEVSYLNALTEIVLQGKPSAVEPAIEGLWLCSRACLFQVGSPFKLG